MPPPPIPMGGAAAPTVFWDSLSTFILFNLDLSYSVWYHAEGGACFNRIRHVPYPKRLGFHDAKFLRPATCTHTGWHWHRETKLCMKIKIDDRKIIIGSTTPSAIAKCYCDINAACLRWALTNLLFHLLTPKGRIFVRFYVYWANKRQNPSSPVHFTDTNKVLKDIFHPFCLVCCCVCLTIFGKNHCQFL